MNKELLVRELSKRTNYAKSNIRVVLQCLEDIIIDEVSKGEEVRFMKGASIYGKLRPETIRKSNLTKKDTIIPEKMQGRVKFTKWFDRQINRKDSDGIVELESEEE
jgi:nucleoid DNA-binding protein